MVQYSSSNLKILHQNIRGLNNKIEELLISLCTLEPQVLCLTEHHMRIVEIDNINLYQYTLGAKYCRQKFEQGSVSIFIRKDINYSTIDLDKFSKEKDFEICTINIPTQQECLLILCTYRSPSGDFKNFLQQLELVMNKLYKLSNNIIICGDFNVNFLEPNPRVFSLQTLLRSFGLVDIVKFPTRIVHNSHTLIDKIFLDKNRCNTSTQSITNGISDHDAQMVVIMDLAPLSVKNLSSYSRIIDDNSIRKFTEFLSHENSNIIFQSDNINNFNAFTDTYVKIF